MPIHSAGILLYRTRSEGVDVFLVHPGGPFWKTKDAGAWSIPRGIIDSSEVTLEAAKREFKEETGLDVEGDCALLGTFRQTCGKRATAYAAEGDCDTARLVSNTFS